MEEREIVSREKPVGTKNMANVVSPEAEPKASESKTCWNFRNILIGFVAVSVSLPMAWISLAKVLLFIGSGALLIYGKSQNREHTSWRTLNPSKLIFLILISLSVSLSWTQADNNIALLTLVKHSKLLEIPLLMLLVRTRNEARLGIFSLIAGQVFLLLSSWVMVTGVPIPWTTHPIGKYVVFSSYLDQSIMFATSAGVFWHLRSANFAKSWVHIVLATSALLNVFLLLDGRTGYMVAIAVITFAIAAAAPVRARLLAVVVAPLLVLLIFYFGSTQVQDRLSKIVRESQNYSNKVETDTSSGWRINAWSRSLQAIAEEPLQGHGVGSWAITVKRIQGDTGIKVFGEGNASNPHQEYLLWGVELGVFGTILLVMLFASILQEARRFSPVAKRATLSVVVSMMVACLFNSALYDDLLGDYFCITIGLLLAFGSTELAANDRFAENMGTQ